MTPASQSPFSRLRVWHDAVDLSVSIYRATDRWPAQERFGLTSQVRRAAVSVAANVAEGSARLGPKSFHAFCQIAFGSIKELEALLIVAVALGFSSDADLVPIRAQLESTSKQLSRLLQRLRSA